MTQTMQELAQDILKKRYDKRECPSLRVVINPDPSPLTRKEVAAFLAPCELTTGDLDFLMDRLPIKSNPRMQALEDYRNRWIAHMDREPQRHKKQNVGRCAANTWLMQQVLGEVAG